MKQIPLSKGKVALVDAADFEFLNQWKWYAHCDRSGNWYAIRHGYDAKAYAATGKSPRRYVSMHCSLTGLSRTDHRNGNGLDNRRHNLRAASSSQNMANSKLRKDNTSGYKGVCWRKDLQKWQAYINSCGHRHMLGCFYYLEDAARAYDVAAKKLFGEFARLNFPNKTTNKNTKTKGK